MRVAPIGLDQRMLLVTQCIDGSGIGMGISKHHRGTAPFIIAQIWAVDAITDQVGKVRVEIWTHKIDGLNEADFIFAAKADALL